MPRRTISKPRGKPVPIGGQRDLDQTRRTMTAGLTGRLPGAREARCRAESGPSGPHLVGTERLGEDAIGAMAGVNRVPGPAVDHSYLDKPGRGPFGRAPRYLEIDLPLFAAK
jgi:hypothetical protein